MMLLILKLLILFLISDIIPRSMFYQTLKKPVIFQLVSISRIYTGFYFPLYFLDFTNYFLIFKVSL